MADSVYTGTTYRLRSGPPTDIGTQGQGTFVVHTFKSEKNTIDNYLYTNSLPASEDFVGQGGDLLSAQFNRVQDINGNVFTGSKTHRPEYVDEGSYTHLNSVTPGIYIECSSVSISYDNMGRATLNYTVVCPTPMLVAYDEITLGGRTFRGYVSNISLVQTPQTNIYECQVSMLTTTNKVG